MRAKRFAGEGGCLYWMVRDDEDTGVQKNDAGMDSCKWHGKGWVRKSVSPWISFTIGRYWMLTEKDAIVYVK